MKPPLFSIVIPTRNRAPTLRYALRTALAQEFDDFEVLVCDDASADDTAQVVAAHDDGRVRYVRSARPLGIAGNFESGASQARGTYTVFLGDDDGLRPDALERIARVIRETGAFVVRWHRALYQWPNHPLERWQNHLIYSQPRRPSGFAVSQDVLRIAARLVDANPTPGLVNSAVHRDVFERLRAAAGRVVLSYAADTSSGFAIPCVVNRVYMLNEVLGVTGVSEYSHGTLLFLKQETEIEREFRQLARANGFSFAFWGRLGSSISAIVLDSAHDVARHFPDKIPLGEMDFVRAYAQSIVEYDMVRNASLRAKLVRNLYRLATESHGIMGVVRLALLVARGRVARRLNEPKLRVVSSVLRMLLRKPYSSRKYYDGDRYGFSDVLGASLFLQQVVRRERG